MFFNVNGKNQQSLLHFQQKYVIIVSNIWYVPKLFILTSQNGIETFSGR